MRGGHPSGSRLLCHTRQECSLLELSVHTGACESDDWKCMPMGDELLTARPKVGLKQGLESQPNRN